MSIKFQQLNTVVQAIIILLLHEQIEGYENAYMIELKLDNPLENIKTGGEDKFIIHTSLNQYHSSAKHRFDKNWIVVHKDNYIKQSLNDIELSRIKNTLKPLFEKKENNE